jgi:phosphate:Na+ symporter
MDINELKTKTISMADRVYSMLEFVEQGFMENRLELLENAMKEETGLNEMEKSVTESILKVSKLSKSEKEKKSLSILEEIVEMLERMGDEAMGLIERIEIKVNEKLLFSETGVEQFNETYRAMKKSVEMMREFLEHQTSALKERIIDNGFHVKELVERYRKEHTDRLIKGICSPIAANMYFDMLDFTGNLARHSSNIVKLF